MNEVGLKICKQEVEGLMKYIQTRFNHIEFDASTLEYYRFLAKQISFFKYILQTYPHTFAIKVLISDFFNFIVDDINGSIRYLHLNERSIIENYMRLILKDDSYNTHINSYAFSDLKTKNAKILSEAEYSKIKNEYAICCSFIHGGYDLKNHLAVNFEECISGTNILTKRTKLQRIRQTTDLLKILNKLFICNNFEVVDNSFHRNKFALTYIMGRQSNLIGKVRTGVLVP